MRTIKVGQEAIFVKNGVEVRVTVVGANDPESFVIQTQDDNEPNMAVRKSELLPLKGPFFDIRGLVFTTSVKHPGEQGEIIKRGKGADGARFFCVQFSDDSTEWLNEHEVCIEVEATQVEERAEFQTNVL